MDAMAGPQYAAAALLVLAGAPKVFRPDDTRRALRSVGWRIPSAVVRTGGGAEAVIGVVALGYGGRPATGLLAASYLGFTGFVVLALRRGGALASCGCLGKPDTPPTRTHVAVTAGFALVTALAAAGHPAGVGGLTDLGTARAIVLVGFAALTGWLAWLALVELPRVSMRQPARD